MAYTLYMHVLHKEISGKENDMRYIGITRRAVEQRWKNGKGYCGMLFYDYIQKYGWESFEHIILEKGLTQEDAEKAEIKYIKEYNTTNRNFGFNVSEGGNIISEETARKISESQLGEKNHMYGKHPVLSALHKKHISESKKGSKNPMYGKKRSQKARELTSKALMGHTVSEDTRRKIGEGHRGIKRSPESMQNAWNAVRGKPAWNRKQIFCVETGERFESLKSAAECKHSESSNLCRALKNGTTFCGYHWKYLEEE